MSTKVDDQKKAFEDIFTGGPKRWETHDTKNPLIRYLRDRRLHLAVSTLRKMTHDRIENYSVLVVCGGVGGEGTFFLNHGWTNVTNSDFTSNAIEICRQRDPRLKTLQLNAESMDLDDGSYDLVVVQDGLHHLPRPALGLNEMVRVSRKAVIVLEPHIGLVARLIGTEWEKHGDATNFVFRWNLDLFRQTILSQILQTPAKIKAIRLWDHNFMVHKVVHRFGPRMGLLLAKIGYASLRPFNSFGNNFIGILYKESQAPQT